MNTYNKTLKQIIIDDQRNVLNDLKQNQMLLAAQRANPNVQLQNLVLTIQDQNRILNEQVNELKKENELRKQESEEAKKMLKKQKYFRGFLLLFLPLLLLRL